MALGSSGAGSHRKRAARCGKERIRIDEAYLMEEMADAEATDAVERAAIEEEAICARILKKRQWRNTRALMCKKNHAVRQMVRLPPKEEKEVSGGEDCFFDRYFHDKGSKGTKTTLRVNSHSIKQKAHD
ncbi:Pyrophosphate-energized vacuolar membrane proton pump [Hordeum vulgare]|nr:Pyrophosphate-energized vacuolar membrane proton pump [Hordeum vulgare]